MATVRFLGHLLHISQALLALCLPSVVGSPMGCHKGCHKGIPPTSTGRGMEFNCSITSPRGGGNGKLLSLGSQENDKANPLSPRVLLDNVKCPPHWLTPFYLDALLCYSSFTNDICTC